MLTFDPELAKIESDLALPGKLIPGARIMLNENAAYPDTGSCQHGWRGTDGNESGTERAVM